MALRVRDLTFAYEAGTSVATPALEAVDLEVRRGEYVVCVGATGSGKSTLLRLCAGLLKPSAGIIEVDGSAAMGRGQVGIVFQNPESQFFAETVAEDVAFGPRNLGMDDIAIHVDEALRSVGLDPETFGERSPFMLSGGEARRAAIAGVLAMRTPYLLLDEPTAGLDPLGRRAVMRAVQAAREHAGILVVTHDADEFLPWADRIVALQDGAVAFSGTPSELVENPDLWKDAGLMLPPLVMAQHLARRHGAPVMPIALDVQGAARALAGAGEGP